MNRATTTLTRTAAFKAKVALARSKAMPPSRELAQRFDVHPDRITQWKSQLLSAHFPHIAGVISARLARRDLG